MAEDSIDVRLGATDEGLASGLDAAADHTKEATGTMGSAFVEMASLVAESMARVTESITEGAAKAQEGLEEFAGRISGVQKAMLLLGEVAVLGFIGDKVMELARDFAEFGDRLDTAAKQSGQTTDEVQKLDFAAAHSGLSADSMNMAMVRLARTMANAQQGVAQATDAFKSLGISADQLKGAGLDEVLLKVANAFQAHADGANKAALAQQLFGRSGAELISFLDQGASGIEGLKARAEELGIVLGEQDVEAAERLHTQLVELDAQMSVLKLRVGAELAPVFGELFKAMSENIQSGGVLHDVIAVLENVFIVIIEVVAMSAETFEEWAIRIVEAFHIVNDVATNFGRGVGAIMDEAGKRVDELRVKTERLIDTLEKASPELNLGGVAPYSNEGHGYEKHGGGEGKKPDFELAGKGTGQESKIAEARLALEKAQQQASFSLTKEGLDETQRLYDDAYANGLLSIQQYYDTKLAITQAGLDADIAAKKAEQAAAEKALSTAQAHAGDTKGGGEESVLKARTQLVTITGQLNVLEQKLAISGVENTAKREDAERKFNATIEQSNISTQSKIATDAVDMAQQSADARYNMGLISKTQLLEIEQQLAQQKYDIDQAALKQQLSLEDSNQYRNPAKVAELNNQLLALDADYQKKRAQLAQDEAVEEAASAKQATTDLQDGFAKTFASIADGSQKAGQAFMNMLKTFDQQLTELVSKKLFEQLFQSSVNGSTIGNQIFGQFQKLFGGGSGSGVAGATAEATGAASKAAQSAAQTADTTALTAHTTADTALTSVMVTLTAAAQAAADALMQVALAASSGGGGGGGGAGGGLGSLLSGLGSSGDFGGAFGFTATGATGSTDAVISGLGSGAGDTAGMSALMGLASFDVGTPYVPNDMVAKIHQGERIVPAYANRPEFSGSASVTNVFNLPGQTDLRTQSQIAALAGQSIQQALQRNG